MQQVELPTSNKKGIEETDIKHWIVHETGSSIIIFESC